MSQRTNWRVCRDEEHGFSLRHPPDWQSTTPEGRCVQLQKGKSDLPNAVPEVDVFISVRPLEGKFPDDYLISGSPLSRGVKYTDRHELRVSTLSAVRAKFESLQGVMTNWGVEYAIRKDENVMRIYISQPKTRIEKQFDAVVNTLRW